MRIVFIEVRNFRGIRNMDWAPGAGMNCLIGPGDSTKTTILDAIELCLNPRSYVFVDDSNFFDLEVKNPIRITVTIAGLPTEFVSDNRYGMYLRGWNTQSSRLEDESGEGLEDALSVRVSVDQSLEARWSIFNQRIDRDESDPPTLRYKDSKQMATTRLGAYAERHLGWGRQSILTRISENAGSVSLQLARASRAAREAFRQENGDVFAETAQRAEELGKLFSVPVREKYAAELDVQGVNITAGGIALHDGRLPLRRLGTGSSRLIVSALQHDAGGSHIALIDEIEHGLEPHRIARVLRYLQSPNAGNKKATASQIFMTTHSPVVIMELKATDLSCVRSDSGTTQALSVTTIAKDTEAAQRLLRASPDAFLARRVVVGEGRTEQGFLRGLDVWWSSKGKESFALCGVIVIDGRGKDTAPVVSELLLDLGYETLMFLDTNKPAPAQLVKNVRDKGGVVIEWPDACCTEERVFLDVPWQTVKDLVTFAEKSEGADSVKNNINNACRRAGVAELVDLTLPMLLDRQDFRRAVGNAANSKGWFKDITRGELLAEIIAPSLDEISTTPLGKALRQLRLWTDGR